MLEGHAKHRPHQRIHAFPVPLASGEHLVHRKGEVLGDPIHHGVQQAALGDEVVEDCLLSDSQPDSQVVKRGAVVAGGAEGGEGGVEHPCLRASTIFGRRHGVTVVHPSTIW